VRRALGRGADLVTVTVGANDLRTRWSAYVPAALALRAATGPLPVDPQPVLDRLAPPPFICAPVITRLGVRLRGLLGWLGERVSGPVVVTTYYAGDDSPVVKRVFTDPVNTAIRAAAAGLPGVRVVDLDRLFAGRGALTSPERRLVSTRDGLHPNDAGQRAIAGAVLRAVAEMHDVPVQTPGGAR
jgi:lysophospholipase L1-like esterase